MSRSPGQCVSHKGLGLKSTDQGLNYTPTTWQMVTPGHLLDLLSVYSLICRIGGEFFPHYSPVREYTPNR